MTDAIPFPSVIDSSMRGAFSACPQKFYYNYLLHLHPSAESPDLKAGGAFARGLEVARKSFWGQGLDDKAALGEGIKAFLKEWGDYEPPEYHVKQQDRMAEALVEYFSHYGWTTDHVQPLVQHGEPAVEFSFALPIPETHHPVTGEPILYAGRFDMLGIKDDVLFVVDEKTTKQLGQSWMANWKLRSQLTGYCWAAQEFGYPVAGAIIRGISILKTKYGHAEVIEPRAKWEIERWLHQLSRDVSRMIQCWKDGYWDFDLDSACSSYGGCAYMDLCTSPHPERWIETSYVKRVWNPLEVVKK